MERYIEANKNRLVGLLKEFVSIATVNPPGDNYVRMVSVLEKHCRRIGLKTKRVIVPKHELKKYGVSQGEERVNLIARWDTGAKKTLHINGHYDVVPATSNWLTDPFKPLIKNNRVYGRGTEDMKANIASYLMAIEALKAKEIVPKCNIELSFTPDEETGGKTGFAYLVNKGKVKCDYAIGEGYHGNFTSYGNKGIIWFKIEVLGKSCHSSEPHKGINAFEKMILIASELVKLKGKISKRKTLYSTKKSIDRHPTMVMGGELYGGNKTNIVPDKAVFSVDRRVLPEENMADAKKEILSVINRLKKKDKDLRVKVHIDSSERPAVCGRKNALVDLFSKSIKKVIGKRGKSALLAGATDMRFLIRKGVPSIGYSVDGGNTCHCDNEYIKIKSLVDTTKVFADVIANIA
ncbi:MAG: M20 family metallopeptidase [Candidatus Omnitrophica bacterium]|nr:M20 family metallopeptidase [Candidatus Omnitrophota bacterium]